MSETHDGETRSRDEALVRSLDAIATKLVEAPKKRSPISLDSGITLGAAVVFLGGLLRVYDYAVEVKVGQNTANGLIVETRSDVKELKTQFADLDRRLSFIEGKRAGEKDGGK